MPRVYRLDATQRRDCVAHVRRWRQIEGSADPADFAAAGEAALKLYDLVGIERPAVVLRAGSPTNAVLMGSFAHALLTAQPSPTELGLTPTLEAYVRKAVQGKKVLPGCARPMQPNFVNRCKDIATQTYSRITQYVTDAAFKDYANVCQALDKESPIEESIRQNRLQIEGHLFYTQRDVIHTKCPSAITAVACLSRKFASATGTDLALLTAIRDILLPGQIVAPATLAVFETLAKTCGSLWLHENVLVVIDRPTAFNTDKQSRLHCETGPSVVYSDGEHMYHLSGVQVPAMLVEHPELLTAEMIDKEQNTEVRRIMLDRFGGVEKFMRSGGGKVTATLPADYPYKGLRTGRVLVKQFKNETPLVYVDLLNSTPEPDGTTKRYLLRVDPWAYDGNTRCNVHAAAASTWRYADLSLAYPDWRDYRPVAES